MVEIKYQLSLNLRTKKYGQPIPIVTANDNVVFEIELWDGPVMADLTGASRYTLVTARKNQPSVIREGALVNGLIVFELGSSEAATSGRVDATVQIYDADNNRISSVPFSYDVVRDPSLNGSLPADDKTLVIANESLLTEAIQKADSADDRISNIVAQAGIDNTEIVDMRLRPDGSAAPTAGDRMREIDVKLAEKATKSSAACMVLQKLQYNHENANIVVLGDSTGNETYEWVYLLAQKLGELYPTHTVNYRLWDNTTKSYGTPVTIRNGTGGNVLNIWNASVSGQNLYYPLQYNFKEQVIIPNPDLVIISHGHNEGNLTTTLEVDNQRTRYFLLTQQITNFIPNVPIMLIAQNPQVGNTVQKKRVPIIAKVASIGGYGFVNVHDTFLKIPNWESTLMGDSVHPSIEGSKVWLNEVMKQFNYVDGLMPLPQPPSSFSSPVKNLLFNGDFRSFDGTAVPNGWDPIGFTQSLSKDTTNFETKGYGVKMKSGAGSAVGLVQYVNVYNTDFPLDFYKGKYITLAARLRKPTGQPSTTGRVALYDGVQTFTSERIYDGDGKFYWDCATMKISENATTIRAYIYGDTATTGNMEATVDRAVLTFGILPKDII